MNPDGTSNGLPLVDRAADPDIQQQDSSPYSQALLDSLPHPAMLIRRDRTILAANTAAKRLGAKVGGYCWRDFGSCKFLSEYHRGLVKDLSWQTLPVPIKCTFCRADEALDAKKSVHIPEIKAFDRLWDTWWVPLYSDMYLHYAIDVTTQKQTENELRQYRERLEGIVQERTTALQSVNDQLWREIVERRKTERALRESEERFRLIFEKSKAIKLLIDPKSGNIVDANQAACDFYGYPMERMKSMNISSINTLSPAQISKELSSALAEDRNHFLFKHKLASGEIRDVEVYSNPVRIHDENLLFSIVHDITERRLTEELLRMEHNKFLSIANSTENAVFIINPEFQITYLNPVAVREFGPVGNRKCYEYFHGDSAACPWCKQHDSPDSQAARWVWTSPGNHKTYDVFDTPFQNPDGTLSRLEILHDVTEHKRIQEALRLSEMRLAALLELAQMSEATLHEITRFVLDQAIKLTGSQCGAIGLKDHDGDQLAFYTSNAGVPEPCALENQRRAFPFGEPSLWENALHSGRPIIVNDYSKYEQREERRLDTFRRLHRLLIVPFSMGQRMQAVAATANKKRDYELSDVRPLTLLLDGMCKLIQRRQSQQSLVESQQQLRTLSSRLLRVREEEKKYLAGELHDKVGQAFAAIKYGLENILKINRDNANQTLLNSIEALLPLVQKSIDDVRNMYTDLRPSILDDFGLIAALEWLCREFRKNCADIHIEVQLEAEEVEVPHALKIIIFRFVQEALHNIRGHSKAGVAHVCLAREGNRLSLYIRDNGCGFDAQRILSSRAAGGGLGLASMKELTELSQGSFAVESSLGAGTLLRASWPV